MSRQDCCEVCSAGTWEDNGRIRFLTEIAKQKLETWNKALNRVNKSMMVFIWSYSHTARGPLFIAHMSLTVSPWNTLQDGRSVWANFSLLCWFQKGLILLVIQKSPKHKKHRPVWCPVEHGGTSFSGRTKVTPTLTQVRGSQISEAIISINSIFWVWPPSQSRQSSPPGWHYMFRLGNPDINLYLPRASILGGPKVYVSSSATHLSSDQNPSYLKYTGDYTTPFI